MMDTGCGSSRQVGRLAQLVRAPALQAGCRGFESLTAHQDPFQGHPETSKKMQKSPVNTGDFVLLRPEAYYESRAFVVVFLVNIAEEMVVFHEIEYLEGLCR